MGLWALGLGVPNFKAVATGRLNGFEALQIIQRHSKIPLDDESAKDVSKSMKGAISFENVKFQYPNAKETTLKGVDIQFEQNKTTAIVGPSGSGKSTIV